MSKQRRRSSSNFYVQKYDAAGNPVGARHTFYPVGGGSVYALPNGGYVVTYTAGGGGHGPQPAVLRVFDSTSTVTGSNYFPQSLISSVTVSTDAFAVGGVPSRILLPGERRIVRDL